MPSRRSASDARASAAGTVQAWVLPYVINWVESQGIDSAPFRRLPGLTDLADPDARGPEAAAEAAWRLAAAWTQDWSLRAPITGSMARGDVGRSAWSCR